MLTHRGHSVIGAPGAPAGTTTQSHANRDFPVSCKKRRIGGVSCGRFVSADDQLNVTGLFYAVVSAPKNPVSPEIETSIGGDSFEWEQQEPCWRLFRRVLMFSAPRGNSLSAAYK